MSTVVASHTLEAAGELRLLLADFLQILRNVFSKPLEFVADVRKSALDIFMEFLRLVHVSAPFLAVSANVLLDVQPPVDAVAFKQPFLAADLGVKNLLLQHIVLVDDLAAAAGHVSAELEFVVDGIIDIVILDMHHVGNVSVTFEFVAELIRVIITAESAAIVTNNGLLKPDFVGNTHLGKGIKD